MSNPKDYAIGWICTISTERVAAEAFLDERHDGPESISPNDNNDYTLGRIGRHNVVIAILPDGEYGTSSAAAVARDMLHSFPNVRIGLMVGIGGGAPSLRNDIRLGDIVVNASPNGQSSVLQYDFGKTIQDQDFRITGSLNQSPVVLRTALNGLKAQYEGNGHTIEEDITNVFAIKPRLRKKYKRPEKSNDRLYKSNITHPIDKGAVCSVSCGGDQSNLMVRPERTDEDDDPMIHYGRIASANQLMKDATIRDKLTAEHNILCFEMEASGLMNHFPCLVIRGICDYSDSHKNKDWQGYAAMAAAAYAKDLLRRIAPSRIEAEKRITDIVFEVKEGVEDVKRQVHKLVSGQHAQQDQNILKWLTETDFGAQQNDFIRQRQPGTGQWFLESDEFQAWVKTENQTLFCPGIPGAGKTIMSASVIDDLYSRFQDDQTIGIAYIYFNHRQHESQIADDLLASLLKQLARRKPSLPESVKAIYDTCQKSQTRPSFEKISLTLDSVVAMYSRVFIVIDALDECRTSDNTLTRFLKHIFKLRDEAPTNIFATSRPSTEISSYFSKGLSRTISAIDEDITNYLNAKISLQKSETIDNEMQEMIVKGVLEASDGMFLLARLHADTLMSKFTKGHLKQALQKLGKGMAGLDKTYDQAMGRIADQEHEVARFAKQILAWIIHSKRPLGTLELRHALAVQKGTAVLDPDFLPATKLLVSLCAGLVIINEESSVVQLVHYTTQEYFERTKSKWFRDAELEITTTCVTYLSFNAFESGVCADIEQRLQSHPLYDYAAQNWGHHAYGAWKLNKTSAKSCEVKAKSEALSSLVVTFLKSTAKVEASGQALSAYVPDRNGFSSSERNPKGMTGIHLATYFRLEVEVSCLLGDGCSADLKDFSGRTPLLLATSDGNEAIVKLLLDSGRVDIDIKDRLGQTPLLIAASNGYETVVRLLLDTDRVNIDARNE
ncbi:putative ankyrin repeat protein, partial [Ilyonectria robusta]|uniref:putative ankyrin repeat protein n=1 Tax=Ilyonectria robusta TaxID=1079257 RepID=UPI001E8DDF77